MNNVTGAVPGSVGATGQAKTGKGRNEMGQEEFLQLLVTQLKYQDPLSPMSNEEFIAQTAQFASLETLEKINDNIKASNKESGIIGGLWATSMIGKDIIVDTDKISLKDGVATGVEFDVPENMDVFVSLRDQTNKFVREERISGESGTYKYVWDGNNSDGKSLENGIYSVKVQAVNADGESRLLSSMAMGTVSGARMANGGGVVMLGNLEIPVSDVVEVRSVNN